MERKNKVFTVFHYSDTRDVQTCDFLGVFSSKEKANECAERYKKSKRWYDQVEIEEVTVDSHELLEEFI